MKMLAWGKRRFYDFRNGHGTYLIYFISFLQFVIISYSLYISDHPQLTALFPSVYHWIAFFLVTYIPAAVFIGHIHLKKQVPVEAEQNTKNNPFTFQTTPGKEQLYQLPANVFSYEMQLLSMEMTNRNAEIQERLYKEIFNKDVTLPRYPEQCIRETRKYLEWTRRLQHGENINDIVKASN